MDLPITPPCISLAPLLQATFLERENRFRIRIQVAGVLATAHLANPGRLKELLTPGCTRLKELLTPGCTVWVRRADRPSRKTAYDLALVQQGETLISVDAHVPNRLLYMALQSASLAGLAKYTQVQAEVTVGHSRIDFLLTSPQRERCWLEAKSVTLVQGHKALFPDAPTKRGRRHLETLMQLVRQGEQAAVVFVIQRPDAVAFSPNDATDQAFGEALRVAAASGVKILAWRCAVTTDSICLGSPVSVYLDPQRS